MIERAAANGTDDFWGLGPAIMGLLGLLLNLGSPSVQGAEVGRMSETSIEGLDDGS